MVIKYHISPYPTLSEDMRVRIWEAQSDGVNGWVYEQVIPQPHTAPVTITVNGMDRVVHVVRLYTQSGTLLHEYNVEPMSEVTTIFDPIRFKIGDGQATTPVPPSNDFYHPALENLHDNDYEVFRNNYGYLFPLVHRQEVVSPPPGFGGFALLNGDAFNDAEEFVIFKKALTSSSVVNDSVVGKWFGGFLDVAISTDYLPSHLRKLIRFTGSNGVYNFPNGTTIPIGYGFAFNHFGAYGGTSGKGTINFSNAPLLWGNTTKNSIDINSFQDALFTFDGTNWNVVYLTDSNYANLTTLQQQQQQPFAIIAAGTSHLGDVPPGDNTWEIIHNKAIVGDYIAVVSIFSANPATYWHNNKLPITWFHDPNGDKANRFIVSIQEITNETEDVSISWIIIKL